MKPFAAGIIILFIIALGCVKDNSDPLPPETHTGAFTFGCRVDGKVYATSGKPVFAGLGDGSVSYSTSPGDSTVYISAVHRFTSDFDFDISLPFPAGTGTYSLKGSDYGAYFADNKKTG